MNTPTLTMTALITPFNKEGTIDFEGFKKLVQYQLDSGIKDLLVLGATGESLLLDEKEKQELLEFALKIEGPRWWLGCLEMSLKKAKDLLQRTASLPLQGYVILVPPYIKATQSDIEYYFRSLLDISAHPCILYNNPSRCSVNASESTLGALFDHPQLAGVKDCDLHPLRLWRLREKMKPHHFLLVGDDAYLPGALCHGANGIIAVLSNTFPLLTKNIVEGCLSAPWHENCQKWLKVCNLIDSLGNPRGIKSLLNILLGTSISLKDPLQSITEKELQNLQKELQLAGFIPTKDLV